MVVLTNLRKRLKKECLLKEYQVDSINLFGKKERLFHAFGGSTLELCVCCRLGHSLTEI